MNASVPFTGSPTKQRAPISIGLGALLLPPRLKLVIVKKSFRLCRDASNDMFIDFAITGKAHYIVTGDRDLLVLKRVMNVQIINASQFLRRC